MIIEAMIKFSITIKDEFSNITVEGDSEKEVLNKLSDLRKLKTESDKILGFDIKIPQTTLDKMNSLTNIEKIMVLLYFNGVPLTKTELHNRNNLMKIKENWWNGRNFSRDIDKKIEGNFVTKINNEPPKYKLTPKGSNFVRRNILDERKD